MKKANSKPKADKKPSNKKKSTATNVEGMIETILASISDLYKKVEKGQPEHEKTHSCSCKCHEKESNMFDKDPRKESLDEVTSRTKNNFRVSIVGLPYEITKGLKVSVDDVACDDGNVITHIVLKF